MALMDDVIGHEAAKKLLLNISEKKNFYQAVIFAGPEGVGKKKLARAIVQEVNCESKRACGECENCRKIAHNADVFLHLIEPQGEKIKIEQIREVIDFISFKSWVPHRFVIIDEVEKMTVQATNALLKSLEEPPEGVHFIFITASLAQILPTIRSRCQVVNFTALSDEELLKICPQLEPWQMRWSFGRVSLAQKIATEQGVEGRKTAINFLHSPYHPGVSESILEQLADSKEREFLFHCWMTYLRDAAVIDTPPGSILFYNSDIPQFVAKFAEGRHLLPLVDEINQLRQDVLGNVDRSLALDHLSFQLSK